MMAVTNNRFDEISPLRDIIVFTMK